MTTPFPYGLPHEAEIFHRSLPVIEQRIIDWLISQNVPALAICSSRHSCLKQVRCSWVDNELVLDSDGRLCVAILVEDDTGPIDVVIWDPRLELVAQLTGSAFALGEDLLNKPAAEAFGAPVRVFQSPLDWLRADRDGIVILRPEYAWARLQHVNAVEARSEYHRRQLEVLIRPRRLPTVTVALAKAAA